MEPKHFIITWTTQNVNMCTVLTHKGANYWPMSSHIIKYIQPNNQIRWSTAGVTLRRKWQWRRQWCSLYETSLRTISHTVIVTHRENGGHRIFVDLHTFSSLHSPAPFPRAQESPSEFQAITLPHTSKLVFVDKCKLSMDVNICHCTAF